LRRLARIDFVDDEVGKPVGIQRFIGRLPIFTFGNAAASIGPVSQR
jgi:hypothetical protein